MCYLMNDNIQISYSLLLKTITFPFINHDLYKSNCHPVLLPMIKFTSLSICKCVILFASYYKNHKIGLIFLCLLLLCDSYFSTALWDCDLHFLVKLPYFQSSFKEGNCLWEDVVDKVTFQRFWHVFQNFNMLKIYLKSYIDNLLLFLLV